MKEDVRRRDGGPLRTLLHSLKGRGLRSIERRGVPATLLLAIKSGTTLSLRQVRRCLTRNPFNPWYQYLDRRYDRRFGVDTAGIDWIPEVGLESANAYSPVPRSTFRHVMRQLPIDHSGFVFVDFGCGKAKTLLLAAEWPFEQAVGVEISPKLVQVAQENLRNYTGERKCREFRIVCTDAAQYGVPSQRAVLYFYDPFKQDVMAAVLENIRRSLVDTPRELYIVYLDPSWRMLLDAAPFLVPVRLTRRYCIYRSACS